MKNKKVFFRICLLVITAISCSSVSRLVFGSPPSQDGEPQSYTIEEALTLANMTLQAGVADPIPSIETVSYTPTPGSDSANINSQIPILGKHLVLNGETFSCIGRAYGVLPYAIAQVNGMELLARLKAGQIIIIPAVPWPNMTKGPVCPAQFTIPETGLELTPQSPQSTEATSNEEEEENNDSNVVAPPVATEPPINSGSNGGSNGGSSSSGSGSSSSGSGSSGGPLDLQCPPFCFGPPIFTFEPIIPSPPNGSPPPNP
jgi:uncharacterized membrane protein YgcG